MPHTTRPKSFSNSLRLYILAVSAATSVIANESHEFRHDTKMDVSESCYLASANWDNAEKPLSTDAENDVLAILNTCFTSNLHKNRQLDDLQVYEILAATGVTAGSGPKSSVSHHCVD